MNLSRVGIICFILLSASLFGCSKPLMVTHLAAKDRVILNKGKLSYKGKKPFGYPSHKWYSKIVCFDEKCRKKAAWVKKQRNDRFKGFKDGGKLPPSPPRKSVPDDTTTMIAKKEPVVEEKQKAAGPSIDRPQQVEQAKADSLIVLGEVLFEVNSFKLKPDLYGELDSLVSFMKENPSTKIEISGHTDATGHESHNLKLSENRADAVAEYIVDKGIETNRVSFNGYGSSRPIAPNGTQQGRAKNRRVEILIHNRK